MKPYVSDPDFTLLNCDVLDGLRSLPDGSVHCVVTSPPYLGLRDYGGRNGSKPADGMIFNSRAKVWHHSADYGVTECGKDATRPWWWWPL